MSHSQMSHDLEMLFESHHSLIVMDTSDENRAVDVITSACYRARLPVFEWSIANGLTQRGRVELERHPETPNELLTRLRASVDNAVYILKDFGPHLSDPLTVRLLRETVQNFSKLRATIVLVGPTEIPAELSSLVTRFQLKSISREELDQQVRALCKEITKTNKIDIQVTQAIYNEILNACSGLTVAQVKSTLSYVMLVDGKLCEEDIQRILEKKAGILKGQGIVEYCPLHKQTLKLGGFKSLESWLDRAKVGFSAEAKKHNLPPPKGILITGVQGCGKSLAAKVIAKSWGLPLLKLEAGRLFDKFIGETEKNFQRATSTAEAMAPCVLWIDEIEKGISMDDGAGGDAGLSKRIFGSFLTWLQEKTSPVFVVATANDLLKLPPELLRKGRFDEIFFVDLPDLDARKEILGIHFKMRNMDPSQFDISAIALATEGFSGAELEQLVISSLYNALYLKQAPNTESLLSAVKSTVPLSVTRKEDLARLRNTAQGRFIPVK